VVGHVLNTTLNPTDSCVCNERNVATSSSSTAVATNITIVCNKKLHLSVSSLLRHIRRVEVQLHSLLTLPPYRRKRWNSHPGRFIPSETIPVPIQQEFEWAPETVWAFLRKEKSLSPVSMLTKLSHSSRNNTNVSGLKQSRFLSYKETGPSREGSGGGKKAT